ncbi:acyl-CoA carboxylase subunit epsilon [Janibacter sp. YIM B02568]|uniref:acyl-CoA carboxylase subunit epsilon n=1 Tax=Janibacter endophyticus TaxID=2806261 RepID=UPI001951C1F5|nr:acyl-CoA carboxylase subunit epsilon [Janibacter endophyticus]MBM6546955.1 acyl-CoA carboxylase subunit epsilon [Janibacter endophyticus]
MAATETTDAPAEADAPATQAIEIIGDATPEQVAALVAVLSGIGGGEEPAPASTSRWASRERLVRREVHPGPDGWRASALPR